MNKQREYRQRKEEYLEVAHASASEIHARIGEFGRRIRDHHKVHGHHIRIVQPYLASLVPKKD